MPVGPQNFPRFGPRTLEDTGSELRLRACVTTSYIEKERYFYSHRGCYYRNQEHPSRGQAGREVEASVKSFWPKIETFGQACLEPTLQLRMGARETGGRPAKRTQAGRQAKREVKTGIGTSKCIQSRQGKHQPRNAGPVSEPSGPSMQPLKRSKNPTQVNLFGENYSKKSKKRDLFSKKTWISGLDRGKPKRVHSE